jgi:hypothetical protein
VSDAIFTVLLDPSLPCGSTRQGPCPEPTIYVDCEKCRDLLITSFYQSPTRPPGIALVSGKDVSS